MFAVIGNTIYNFIDMIVCKILAGVDVCVEYVFSQDPIIMIVILLYIRFFGSLTIKIIYNVVVNLIIRPVFRIVMTVLEFFASLIKKPFQKSNDTFRLENRF